MDLIPAIDLLAGTAVRLKQGRYDAVTSYDSTPEDIARQWRQHVHRLHVVDLEGARDGRPKQVEAVARIVKAFDGASVQVGGGIRTFEAVQRYTELGVDHVVLGTAAIRDPEFVRRVAEAHPGKVIVALDAKGGRVATDGWLEVSERLAVDLARELSTLPLGGFLYTDIERDGMEVGSNVAETARLARETAVPVIASGGVGTLEHLRALAAEGTISGAIVGRALHEGRFSLAQAVEASHGA